MLRFLCVAFVSSGTGKDAVLYLLCVPCDVHILVAAPVSHGRCTNHTICRTAAALGYDREVACSLPLASPGLPVAAEVAVVVMVVVEGLLEQPAREHYCLDLDSCTQASCGGQRRHIYLTLTD